MIDTHGSFAVATAIKLAEELASYDIAWFEEPVSPAWSTTKVGRSQLPACAARIIQKLTFSKVSGESGSRGKA
jgi:L-alanine-DL-glutamate epimerase-like enolase superfamily enzyme